MLVQLLAPLRIGISTSVRTSGRRWRRTGAILAIVAALALIFSGAASGSSTKDTGLKLSVVTTTDTGTPEIPVADYLYLTNANPLVFATGTGRTTLPNAFVVTSVDNTVFLNGVQLGGTLTWTPPPDALPGGFAKRWPSTVSCPDSGPPCNVVLSPAVLPGETTAVLFVGQGAPFDPGTYVFEYTVHGTVNGQPVDLTASAKALTIK